MVKEEDPSLHMGIDSICIFRETEGFAADLSATIYKVRIAMPTARTAKLTGRLKSCLVAVMKLMWVDVRRDCRVIEIEV